jgi:hypothetical protein
VPPRTWRRRWAFTMTSATWAVKSMPSTSQGSCTWPAAISAGPRHAISRRWTWLARSPAHRTRLKHCQAWVTAPWSPARPPGLPTCSPNWIPSPARRLPGKPEVRSKPCSRTACAACPQDTLCADAWWICSIHASSRGLNRSSVCCPRALMAGIRRSGTRSSLVTRQPSMGPLRVRGGALRSGSCAAYGGPSCSAPQAQTCTLRARAG